MELIELANKAHALIDKLQDLRKILMSILDTDAKVARAVIHLSLLISDH